MKCNELLGDDSCQLIYYSVSCLRIVDACYKDRCINMIQSAISRNACLQGFLAIFLAGNVLMFVLISKSTLKVTTIQEPSISNKLDSVNGKEYVTLTENSRNETGRIGCRKFPKGGETCAFSGLACIDFNESLHEGNNAGNKLPQVYFIHDNHTDGAGVTHDNWCGQRFRSADPLYFGPREWPPSSDLVLPRWSCLKAHWRTTDSLFRNKSRPVTVKWVPNLSVINLDYERNSHNNHYLMDIIWLLDLKLWKDSQSKSFTQLKEIFSRQTHFMFPQSRDDFVSQTDTDINRLLFTLIFGLNASELYKNQTRDQETKKLSTQPLLEAFPALEDRLVFSRTNQDKLDYNSSRVNDLICTTKLFAGAKLGNLGHERVCTYLRKSSYDLFGVKVPEINYPNTGYLWIDQPPRRVILLHRHISRGFRNLNEIVKALNETSEKYKFEFEMHTTEELKTAEDNVKFFSRAGVLLTTHGSQSMGAIWMPRHSALIEAFPPAYNDYSFKLLASTCNVQYFELYGKIPKILIERYKRSCDDKLNSHYSQCTELKSEAVLVDVQSIIDTVLLALRKIGHEMPMQESSFE